MLVMPCYMSYASSMYLGSNTNKAKMLQKEMQILRLFYTDKELVITSTRQPKLISKVAKNMSIITKKDIEIMNAHNVADILHRIAGIFLDIYSQDMGSPAFIQIYGSEQRQVLVMIDGMPINFHSEGYAELNSIPVDIIKRIEIIKGPASSSWGSSIGGVINIITKDVKNSKKPTGYIRFSYGERYTYDTGAQVSGRYKNIGYYMFTGRQGTDGLRNKRDYKRNNIYSKFDVDLSDNIDFKLSLGYSDPENDLGKYFHLAPGLHSYSKNHFYFLKSDLKAHISNGTDLNFMFYHIKQRVNLDNKHIFTNIPYFSQSFDEETYGGRIRLGIKRGRHNGSIGIDIERDDMDLTIDAGPALQALGVPATALFSPHREKWAFYINDTIDIGHLSIIPELRYDHDSTTGSFVSPSLGLAYRLGQHTILRAQIARGFTPPPLSWMYGGGIFLMPNKGLDRERIMLYQIGAETSILKYLWIKGTIFRHEIDDYIKRLRVPPTIMGRYQNSGDLKKNGIELLAKSIPFYGFRLFGSYTFVHFNPPKETGISALRKYTCGVRYEDHGIMAELFGNYIWWDAGSAYIACYDHMIWDLNVKKAFDFNKNKAYLYVGIHNLFNGAQYSFFDRKNPKRWVEVGFRVDF